MAAIKSSRKEMMNNQVITPAQYLISNINTKPNTSEIPIHINITSQVYWKSVDTLEAEDRLILVAIAFYSFVELGKHSLPKKGLVG